MTFASNYFERHKIKLIEPQEPPMGLLKFIVVIPVYLEEELEVCLHALLKTKQPSGAIEIILVFNHPEDDSPENMKLNKEQFEWAKKWCEENSKDEKFFIPVWSPNLPGKYAGVGLARKIGMDLAVQRFASQENSEGIILSLDADTLVANNYFTAVEEGFSRNENAGACVIHFEHPLRGTHFSEEVYAAITQYELHLRYYKHALDKTGFPYANFTIGSCFGVKAKVYVKHGGMNKRKGGEDFYFLNKLLPHEEFINLRSTCVVPSPRMSDRVPFGTGPAIRQLLKAQDTEYTTYHPIAFLALRDLFKCIPSLYKGTQPADLMLDEILMQFLGENNMDEKILEIKANTSTQVAFVKRFFLWFDGFKVVKFLNYSHLKKYEKLTVMEAVKIYLNLFNVDYKGKLAYLDLLNFYRTL